MRGMLTIFSLLAFARAVNMFNLVRAKMVEDPVLEIRRCRHILQEKYVERYITNDTLMRGGGGEDQRNMVSLVSPGLCRDSEAKA
jgi:DNA mismatch repair ATPase MutS